MSIRYRQMRPKDVRECAAMVTTHTLIGPRYGSAGGDLHPAWLRLLECEAMTAVVFEEVEGPHVRIWGVGVSVFVSDDFLRELKTPPFFWIGPELARRMVRGNSPLLSNQELREANSEGGLNLVVWEGCIRVEDAHRAEIYNQMMTAFMEQHRGYLWKEVIASQAESVEGFKSRLKSGGMYLNAKDGRYVDSFMQDPQEISKEPHIIGRARELEHRRPGSWVGTLFNYQPPQLGFSRSEQRLLLLALDGGTDEELANARAVSLSAVKKAWRSVYYRVTERLPGILPALADSEEWAPERGKAKKQPLLSYLREHPEELRPVSRRVLVRPHRAGACRARAAESRRSAVTTQNLPWRE